MSIARLRTGCESHRWTLEGDCVMPTERTGTRAASSGRAAIIEMLKADHKKVREAFRDFEKLDPQAHSEQCQAIVEQTLGDVQVHATLEEELFYPAARSCLSDQELVDEAEVEHMTVKVLIEQLKNMKPEDEKYAAMFKVLGEYINHHVKEEEGELFPKLGRAKFEWDRLHDEMSRRRPELEQEFMPHGAAVPDEDMEGEDAQAASR
jgi:hemerythrin superfamily protein